MNTLADTIASDFSGTKLLVGQIAHNLYTTSCVDTIRQVQSDIPSINSNTLPGSVDYDVNLSDEAGDTLHFKSNGDLSVFAQR